MNKITFQIEIFATLQMYLVTFDHTEASLLKKIHKKCSVCVV